MKKRIVSSIMCLAMLLSLLPGAAFAASTTPEPKIESVGYAELGATANTEITTALNAARGDQADTNNAANVTDCDKQTMWAILTGLDTKNQYQFTLKHGSDTITISEDQAKTGKIGPGLPVTVTEGQKGVIGIYWTFNQNADKTNGTVASKAIAVGDYIFQLQVGKPTPSEKTTDFEDVQGATKTLSIGSVKIGTDGVETFYKQGTVVTLTPPASEGGKVFDGWKASDNSTVPASNQITVGKTAVTYTAQWKDAPVPTVTVVPAPLHDQSNRVPDNDLCSGYSVTQPDKNNKIVVSASNVRLHKNADSPASYGYWTGVQFKAPAGYTVKYQENGAWKTDVDDGSYVSLYSDFDKKPANNKTSKITIGLFKAAQKAGEEETSAEPVSSVEYTIDFSGVTAKPSTATLGYTAVADKNVVSDCAPETIWVEFDEPVRPGWLWFDITDPDGVVYGIAASSNELKGKLPTKQAWSFQNSKQFEAWPQGTDGQGVAEGVKTGEYTVVGYYFASDGSAPTQRPGDLASLKKIVDGKVSVVAPVKDVKVAEPAAPKVDATGVDSNDVEIVTNALKNVAVENDSKGVLQNAANTSASTTSSKADYSKQNAADKLNEVDGISGATAGNVNIVYQPYLAVKATAYNGNNKTLTVDITPKCHVLATKESSIDDLKFEEESGNNAVKLGDEPLTVTTPIKLQIGLPADFVANGGSGYPNVYVQHKGYEYTATVSAVSDQGAVKGLLATFINPHGFSTFTVTATSQTVAKIGDNSYTTLKAAVEAAKDGDTITLVKDTDEKDISAKIDSKKTLDFVLGGSLSSPVTVKINGIEITIPAGKKVTQEFGKSEGNNPGNGGGGGGGSVSSNVTVDKATNGKVSVTPTAPSKGATVTINLTPDDGYQVGTVTVTDKDGKAVELTKVSDTKYTFTMPDGKVTVKATFTKVEEPVEPVEPFVDVSKSDYFYDAVMWAVEKNITTGDGINTFSPNKSCTRAQMVTFLWRAAGSPAATGNNPFTDVAAGEYYTDAVLWAVSKGITNGTGDGTFSPNATVSRGQTVTFLYRYAGSPSVDAGNSFNDVASTDYFASAVQWAVANGITYGDGVNTFSPAKDCTRGQIVTFMYRQMAE
ncbi:MAG: S-layer homology domain-containing protein [Ruminiclostridium sp.]|nr:S-layer homology domain-containing protein [Ruminiclostridium sp.]